MQRATVTLEGPDAAVVRAALMPEAGRDIPKARVRVAGTARAVRILVEAEDTGTLRAALNSYLRWADVALRVRQEAHP